MHPKLLALFCVRSLITDNSVMALAWHLSTKMSEKYLFECKSGKCVQHMALN